MSVSIILILVLCVVVFVIAGRSMRKKGGD
jgi:hypothetical protein